MITATDTVDEKTTRLSVDFADEDVELTGATLVAGDESAARAYAHFFEQDLRRNNAELFPVATPEEMPGGDE
ncbi:MAG: hypothetical protein VB076_05080 [Synergistaceae bacterium]|nr:hypothetical protein [Synergistaceae bacterium]